MWPVLEDSGERPASEADAKKGREAGQRCELTPDGPNQSGSGRGGEAGAARSAARTSALPCLNNNNSPSTPKKRGYRLTQSATTYRGPVGWAQQRHSTIIPTGPTKEGLDADGRHWVQADDGQTWEKIDGGLNSGEAKRLFVFKMNVAGFFEHYGRERAAFLTLSPPRGSLCGESPREMAKAWDDARKHRLRGVVSYFRVLEPRKDGSGHYHFGVTGSESFQPDLFDWQSFRVSCDQAPRKGAPPGPEFAAARKRYVESATPFLREMWGELRDVCAHYGLGRSEMLPIRTVGDAVAQYVGGYLSGSMSVRRDDWKGARRVEYDRKQSISWKSASAQMAWYSEGSKAWRNRLSELALAARVPFDSLEGFRQLWGPKWCYQWRPWIMVAGPREWRETLMCAAETHGGEVPPKPATSVGSTVLQWYTSLEHWRETGELIETATTGDCPF
jgi:hypothetical protein